MMMITIMMIMSMMIIMMITTMRTVMHNRTIARRERLQEFEGATGKT